MKEKKEKEKTVVPSPHSFDYMDLIVHCGKLNHTVEQTANIVCAYFPKETKKDILSFLKNPITEEYEAYHEGKNMRLFEIENSLYFHAIDGDNDAQETLMKLNYEKSVVNAISQKFFPDDTD